MSWLNEDKWGVFQVSQSHIDKLEANTKTLYSIMQHANQIYVMHGEDSYHPDSIELIQFSDIPKDELPEFNTFLKF